MWRPKPNGLRDQARSAGNHGSSSTSQNVETMAVGRPCDPGRTQEEALSSYIVKTNGDRDHCVEWDRDIAYFRCVRFGQLLDPPEHPLLHDEVHRAEDRVRHGLPGTV